MHSPSCNPNISVGKCSRHNLANMPRCRQTIKALPWQTPDTLTYHIVGWVAYEHTYIRNEYRYNYQLPYQIWQIGEQKFTLFIPSSFLALLFIPFFHFYKICVLCVPNFSTVSLNHFCFWGNLILFINILGSKYLKAKGAPTHLYTNIFQINSWIWLKYIPFYEIF